MRHSMAPNPWARFSARAAKSAADWPTPAGPVPGRCSGLPKPCPGRAADPALVDRGEAADGHHRGPAAPVMPGPPLAPRRGNQRNGRTRRGTATATPPARRRCSRPGPPGRASQSPATSAHRPRRPGPEPDDGTGTAPARRSSARGGRWPRSTAASGRPGTARRARRTGRGCGPGRYRSPVTTRRIIVITSSFTVGERKGRPAGASCWPPRHRPPHPHQRPGLGGHPGLQLGDVPAAASASRWAVSRSCGSPGPSRGR